MRPMCLKLTGSLSTTRAASGACVASPSRYARPSSLIVAARCSGGAARSVSAAKIQYRSSPAPWTCGCDARICSVKLVPDRGIPTTNTGRSEATPPGRGALVDVIVVLAERVVQVDGVRHAYAPRQHALGGVAPGLVGCAHLAHGRETG